MVIKVEYGQDMKRRYRLTLFLLLVSVFSVACATKFKPAIIDVVDSVPTFISDDTKANILLPEWLSHKFEISNSDPTHVLDVSAAQALTEPEPSWTILEKIKEAKIMLENAELFAGDSKINYQERRISRDSKGSLSVTKKTFSEEEKEIALALLDVNTGEIKIVKIRKKGDILIAPSEYSISIIERASGIRWNYWNTHYKVESPSNLIVIGNRYPMVKFENVIRKVKNSKGQLVSRTIKEKQVDYYYYVPYSTDLHRKEIIQAGRTHLEEKVAQAFSSLRSNGVKSKSFPDKLIADVEVLDPDFFQRIPLKEHSDLGEFILEPEKTAERVLVIIGANGDSAFSLTCNGSNACGWVQFTPGTYKNLRKEYKLAKLMEDFNIGAADHTNSITAAILLYDYNLSGLVSKFGKNIVQDKRIEEYLSASYNGSPSWVHQSLKANLGKNTGEWTTYLRKETLGFMTKLRYLKTNNLP